MPKYFLSPSSVGDLLEALNDKSDNTAAAEHALAITKATSQLAKACPAELRSQISKFESGKLQKEKDLNIDLDQVMSALNHGLKKTNRFIDKQDEMVEAIRNLLVRHVKGKVDSRDDGVADLKSVIGKYSDISFYPEFNKAIDKFSDAVREAHNFMNWAISLRCFGTKKELLFHIRSLLA